MSFNTHDPNMRIPSSTAQPEESKPNYEVILFRIHQLEKNNNELKELIESERAERIRINKERDERERQTLWRFIIGLGSLLTALIAYVGSALKFFE